MTWLFTQVWLWSLAAFALGAALTWLLIVHPMKRRLAALAEHNEQMQRYLDHLGTHEERVSPDEPDRYEPTAFDLLPAAPNWNRDEPPEPERTIRASQERAGRAMPVPAAVPEPQPPEAQSPEPAVPKPIAERPSDDTEVRLEEQRAVPKLRASSELGRWPEVKQGSQPTAPPELDLSDTEAAEDEEDVSTSNSTWFQRKDLNAYSGGDGRTGTLDASDDRPAGKAETVQPEQNGTTSTAAPSGQLTSLFEPVPGDDAPDAPPYIPPVGAEVTQSIPRTPAAPAESEASGPSQAGGDAESTQVESTQAESTQQVMPVDKQVAEDESTSASGKPVPPPLPRRTPGAGPMPGSKTKREKGKPASGPPSNDYSAPPSNDYVVKGNYASKQYHTPDSPYYARVAAEVWFRTASEAEQAGFAPWDGWHRD